MIPRFCILICMPTTNKKHPIRNTKKYIQVYDGQLITLRSRITDFICCDCGLIHRFQFRNKGRFLTYRAWRIGKVSRKQIRKRLVK